MTPGANVSTELLTLAACCAARRCAAAQARGDARAVEHEAESAMMLLELVRELALPDMPAAWRVRVDLEDLEGP